MNYKKQICLSVVIMNTLKELFFCIFVITLYSCEKCICFVLNNQKGIAETYFQFEDSNPGFIKTGFSEADDTPLTLIEIFKRFQFHNTIKNIEAEETNRDVVKRVTRQANYDVKSLYPRLPTAAPYQQQPYQNHNYNFNSQTNNTYPAYQQWPPSASYNNTRPGYPGHTPSYNSSYQTPPYNSLEHQPPHNSRGPYNSYNPSDKYQQHNNPNLYPGYPYNSPVPPGSSNINPYTSPGYPQPSNYSGFPPHSNYGRSNYSYNPSETPTYYQSSPKYPNNIYSSTLSPSFNGTGYGPAQTNFTSNFYHGGRDTNTSHSYYPGGSSYNQYQNNGSIPYAANQYGAPVANLNRTQQSWPYYPTSNNNNNNYPQHYPAHGPGYTTYNNSNIFNPNQGTYPKQTQYGANYYPNTQFNVTNTYRLAENYTPSIPSQPPRNGIPPQNQFYYPINMNGTHQDPTKVSPQRFSYY